ncbi:MAG: hypothetical protein IKD80_02685 [Selenomonadaceae bacterium]|nr:hypothetical protein [Selenomonadaceae bacterium]
MSTTASVTRSSRQKIFRQSSRCGKSNFFVDDGQGDALKPSKNFRRVNVAASQISVDDGKCDAFKPSKNFRRVNAAASKISVNDGKCDAFKPSKKFSARQRGGKSNFCQRRQV